MDNRGIVIPRSQTPSHMAENLDILHFNLTESDMAKLSALPQQKGGSEGREVGPEGGKDAWPCEMELLTAFPLDFVPQSTIHSASRGAEEGPRPRVKAVAAGALSPART